MFSSWAIILRLHPKINIIKLLFSLLFPFNRSILISLPALSHKPKPKKKKGGKDTTYLLMQMIITTLMRLEFVDPSIALVAQIAMEGFAGFARRFRLS